MASSNQIPAPSVSVHSQSSPELIEYLLRLAGSANPPPKQVERTNAPEPTQNSKPSPQKTSQTPSRKATQKTTSAPPSPSNKNSPSPAPARWAGAAFESCPQPGDLPIPTSVLIQSKNKPLPSKG